LIAVEVQWDTEVVSRDSRHINLTAIIKNTHTGGLPSREYKINLEPTDYFDDCNYKLSFNLGHGGLKNVPLTVPIKINELHLLPCYIKLIVSVHLNGNEIIIEEMIHVPIQPFLKGIFLNESNEVRNYLTLSLGEDVLYKDQFLNSVASLFKNEDVVIYQLNDSCALYDFYVEEFRNIHFIDVNLNYDLFPITDKLKFSGLLIGRFPSLNLTRISFFHMKEIDYLKKRDNNEVNYIRKCLILIEGNDLCENGDRVNEIEAWVNRINACQMPFIIVVINPVDNDSFMERYTILTAKYTGQVLIVKNFISGESRDQERVKLLFDLLNKMENQ